MSASSHRKFFILSTLALLGLTAGCATGPKTDPGFTALFNGKDLTGWQYVGADHAVFDGQTASSDKRFTVVDGIITTRDRDRTKEPIRQLRTVAKFNGNFVLRLQFRAGVKADSGIFIGTKQLQCRDYSTVGPYTKLTQYKPQDWNQIEIIVSGNVARCTNNGELLEAAMPVPAGPRDIGLEADAGVLEYRNIEILETEPPTK